MGRASICLCMIVKDEAHIIEETLGNIAPHVDHWLIVDTGSTDGTQDLIRAFMADKPGELVERPWKNFGHNRTEALQLAAGRAEYIFSQDADDQFRAEEGFDWMGEARHDLYDVKREYGSLTYWTPHLMRDGLDWRYVGVVHEYLDASRIETRSRIERAYLETRSAGARSKDPKRFQRDALLLQQGLLDEPENHRYMFYLAQSYRDCDEPDLAIRYYRKRIEMGGWEEEVFYSLYQIGVQKLKRGDPLGECVEALMIAHERRPARAEPLFAIGMEHLRRKEWSSAWVYLSRAARMPVPARDILFVEHHVYAWRALLEAGVAAYWAGLFDDSHACNAELLARPNLDPWVRQRATDNQRYTAGKLAA